MRRIFQVLVVILSCLTINTYAQTKVIELGTTVSGEQKDREKYSFEINVPSAGKLTIKFSSQTDVTEGYFNYKLTQVIDSGTAWQSINQKYKHPDFTAYVEKGKYIYTFDCSGNGTYTIETEFVSAKESFPETNQGEDNSASSANVISLSKTYYGLIMNDDIDVYKFELSEKSKISILFSCFATAGWFNYKLYDEQLNEIKFEMLNYYNKNYGESGDFLNEYELAKGTYYIAITEMTDDSPYSINISLVKEDNFKEPEPEKNPEVETKPNKPTEPEVPKDEEKPKPSKPDASTPVVPEKDDEIKDEASVPNEDNSNEVEDTSKNESHNIKDDNKVREPNHLVMFIGGALLGLMLSIGTYIVIRLFMKRK